MHFVGSTVYKELSVDSGDEALSERVRPKAPCAGGLVFRTQSKVVVIPEKEMKGHLVNMFPS